MIVSANRSIDERYRSAGYFSKSEPPVLTPPAPAQGAHITVGDAEVIGPPIEIDRRRLEQPQLGKPGQIRRVDWKYRQLHARFAPESIATQHLYLVAVMYWERMMLSTRASTSGGILP